ncbi:SRPBCC family protein [Kribbella deserti]|uniref:SRPBCC domain-containing protein n=1 Tax=Kribbella deserti TaxID=1926257 RepID=A0ABV6QPH5_9ACTN
MNTPRIEVTVAAPVEAVWAALREKDKIRHWHGWEFEGLEAEIDLIYFTAYTESTDDHTLEVQGGDRFELSEVDGGTRVVLTRGPHSDDPQWEPYYDDITEGWITFVQQLKFAVERHPADARRTLFYSGTTPLPTADVSGEPGTSYEAEVLGEKLRGEVWFRSEHQLGLTVEGWGDGLLVLSHIPPSDAKPEGASMAVLTLYGVDPDEIDARWAPYWKK